MSVRLTGESEQDYYASQAPTAARVSVPKQGWSSSDTATAVAIGAVAGAAIGIAAAASGVDIVESATRIYEKLVSNCKN